MAHMGDDCQLYQLLGASSGPRTFVEQLLESMAIMTANSIRPHCFTARTDRSSRP